MPLVPILVHISPAAASTTPPAGAAGVVQAPVAARQARGVRGDGVRALGALRPAQRLLTVTAGATSGGTTNTGTTSGGTTSGGGTLAGTTSLPASVDLSAYAPAVGYQGQVNACVSWTMSAMVGYYYKRSGTYPTGGTGGFAPMYAYSQITGGQNSGTAFGNYPPILQAQGIDTRADYTQGDTDYVDLPTASEKASAAAYAAPGLTMSSLTLGSAAQQSIETALAGGDPVGLGIPVYDNFYNASSTNYYISGAVGNLDGNHAVVAMKYDANGVWIENSWGTGWGLNGYAELSWGYIAQYAWQAVVLHGVTAPPAATSTPVVPTATSTAIATNTAVPPTATATHVPPTATSTNTVVPATATATATATHVPATATATNTAVPATATSTRVPATATATNTVIVPSTATSTATGVPATATSTNVPATATATNTAVPPTATSVPATATSTSVPPVTVASIGTASGTHSGNIATAGTADSVAFTPGVSGNTTIGMCAVTTSNDYDLYIYNSAGALVGSSTSPTNCEWVSINASAGQTYTIRTVSYSGTGLYRWAWSVNGAQVVWNVSQNIATSGGSTYISFPILSAGPISLSTCGPTGADFDLYLQDAGFNTLASSTSPSNCESLTYTASSRALYRLQEVAYSGTGGWTGTIKTY